MWYANGTVSVTAGSAVVSAAGAAFVANVQAGDALIVPGSGQPPQEIAAVNSDNQLTLARPWAGANLSNVAFTILPTTGGLVQLARDAAALLASFGAVRDGVGAGLFPDGSLASPGLRFGADQSTGILRGGPGNIVMACGGQVAFNLAAAVADLVRNTLQPGGLILGSGLSGNRAALVDLRTDDGYPYGLRVTRDATGANGGSTIAHKGTGLFSLLAHDAATFVVATASTNRLVVGADGHTRPASDNLYTLGAPSFRWGTIYAASGAINTSDAREKDWRGALTPDELGAAKEIGGSIGIYRWLSAIEEKGEAARLHVGVKAQQVIAVMQAHGLDPMRYGFVCHDCWGAEPGRAAREEVRDADGAIVQPALPAVAALPAGDRYGIRADELLFFLVAAQEQRLAALEAA